MVLGKGHSAASVPEHCRKNLTATLSEEGEGEGETVRQRTVCERTCSTS